MIDRLLAAGTVVTHSDKQGETALHHVRSADVANLLLARGDDVNAYRKGGATALHNDATADPSAP